MWYTHTTRDTRAPCICIFIYYISAEHTELFKLNLRDSDDVSYANIAYAVKETQKLLTSKKQFRLVSHGETEGPHLTVYFLGIFTGFGGFYCFYGEKKRMEWENNIAYPHKSKNKWSRKGLLFFPT